jgi:hypothetical protein
MKYTLRPDLIAPPPAAAVDPEAAVVPAVDPAAAVVAAVEPSAAVVAAVEPAAAVVAAVEPAAGVVAAVVDSLFESEPHAAASSATHNETTATPLL